MCYIDLEPAEVCTIEKICSDCSKDRKEVAASEGHSMMVPSFFRQTIRDCVSENFDGDDDQWQPMLDRLDARRAAAVEKENAIA